MSPSKSAQPSIMKTIVACVIAAASAFAVAALLFVVFFRSDSATDNAKVADDAISVSDALGSADPSDTLITGFVFIGENRTILCSARNRDDPPFCEGSVIDLENLDPTRIDLVVPEDVTSPEGSSRSQPAYSRNEVTVLGSYRFGTLTVRELLG